MTLEPWAKAQVERLIAPLGSRWAHVQAVARQARRVAEVLSAEDGDVLIAAAFLHDVGYAPSLNRLGFHPVDGAHFLRGHGQERLARLAAHHSGAHFETEERGLVDKLAAIRRLEADGLVVRELELAPTGRWGFPACRAVGRRGAT
jgi:HD superfamily phosphodiesterase